MSHQSQKNTSPKPIRELALSRISVGRKHLQLPKRRGSVLILVIAVLVLLALMGTAYIATSRSERVTSSKSQSRSNIDTLANGVLNTIKGSLEKDLNVPKNPDASIAGLTNLPYFTARPTAPGQNGLPILASRAPYAPGTGNGPDRPRWPAISAPLSAIPYAEGTAYPLPWSGSDASVDTFPAGTTFNFPSNTGAGHFDSPIFNVTGTTTYGGSPAPALIMDQSVDGTWGDDDMLRRDALIGWVTLNGVTYPAFFAQYRPDPASVGSLHTGGWVIAADADGDGIADSGLQKLGTLPNPEFSGITFYAGVRVIDNNSAINANTAWTGSTDYNFAGGSASSPGTVQRNNRFFPTAIGLQDSLAPQKLALYPNSPGVDEQNGSTPTFYNNFLTYRSGGVSMWIPNSLTTPPVREYEPGSGKSVFPPANAQFRKDFEYSSQQELDWFAHGRRLDFPGMHQDKNSSIPGARFNTFSLSEQMELTYGFVLAPRDAGETFDIAVKKRGPLVRLLPWSLYRTADQTVDTTGTLGNTWRAMRTDPYQPDQVGTRTIVAPGVTSWYQENFAMDMSLGGTGYTAPIRNLRTALVTRNPVSQASPFKPLPYSAAYSNILGADLMTPYFRPWDGSGATIYQRGDVVYYNSGTKAQFYSLTGAETLQSTTVPGSGGSTDPWTAYSQQWQPTKVNINRAPFGDLWRGFYAVMSSNAIQPDAAYTNTAKMATVSPFGAHVSAGLTVEQERWRGMAFTTPANAQSQPTPSQIAPGDTTFTTSTGLTFHPDRMFRPNVKDYVTGSIAPGTPDTTIRADQMVALRAAQAAVNAEYLRSCNQSTSAAGLPGQDDIVRRYIPLKMRLPNQPAGSEVSNVRAEVYSAGKFPYITEIYANTDPRLSDSSKVITDVTAQANPGGFIAVELYNPYPFKISLANFKIQLITRAAGTANPVDRTNGTATTGRDLVDVFEFNDFDATVVTNPVIQPGDFIVLHNYEPTKATVVTYGAAGTSPAYTVRTASEIPAGAGALPPGKSFFVPGLERALGVTGGLQGEMVISRPMIADITGTTGDMLLKALSPTDPTATRRINAVVKVGTIGAERQEYYVPFDSIDFTGVKVSPVVTDTPDDPATTGVDESKLSYDAWAYHYSRRTTDWRFVYPGRYDGSRAALRQQGLIEQQFTAFLEAPKGSTPVRPTEPAFSPALSLGTRPTVPGEQATYSQTFPLQIANFGMGGMNATVLDNINGLNRYPLGGFARLGDILQVPFISPVKIRIDAPQSAVTAPGKYVDVISLTADASFAEDTDTKDDTEENIGRFTPIITPRKITVESTSHPLKSATLQQIVIDEYGVKVDFTGKTQVGFLDTVTARYGWATSLFDHFAVMSPSDMMSPDAQPMLSSVGQTVYNGANYPAGMPLSSVDTTKIPQRVAGKGSNYPATNQQAQASAGIDGLININTAPLSVLAAVPWVRTGVAANDRDMNLRIAQAIINYREPHVVGMTVTAAPTDLYSHNDDTAALPTRPFRSLFELNKVLMVAVDEATGRNVFTASTGTPGDASFRTGGLLNASTSNSSVRYTPGAAENGTTGLVSAYSGNLFLTPDEGFFRPMYALTATIAPPVTPDPRMPGTLNSSPVPVADPASVNDRLPIGDFASQYQMMTAVSNLITTRSDTFTAYIVIEGWKNAGTAKAERVIQRRYAYIIDRSGTGSSVPIDPKGKFYPLDTSGVFTGQGNRSEAAPVQSYAVPAVTPSN